MSKKKMKELNEEIERLKRLLESKELIGDVLLELERVLDKMCDHGLQLGDIHALVHNHVWSHRKDAVETYVDDDSHPVLRYGHKDQV